MMKQPLFRHLLVLCLSVAAPVALAASNGTAVGVRPDAVVRVNSIDRILEVGADVSVGEVIVTGPAGQVQIVFSDNTRLVVGPGSSLLIETYLMASSNTAKELTINALSGSFRFITGNSPKPAYTINTPTASIAVRGTEFDIISEPRSTRVMLYEGALQLCNSAGLCTDVTDRCQVGVASSDVTLFDRNDPERTPLGLEFRYARFQAPLLPEFRVDGAAICAEPPSPESTPQTLNPGSGPAPSRNYNTP